MKQEDLKMVHMYLDGDLSGPALQAFEERLRADSALREALEDMRALVRDAGKMKVFKAPEVRFSGVRLRGPRLPGGRTASFLAGASLAAACVLIALAVGPGPTGSPDPGPDRETVRMIYYAPEASSVSILGDFNGWSREIPLSRRSGDYWSAEIRVQPGEYRYVLLVDGVRKTEDPLADYVIDDDFGSKNSVVRVGL